MKQEFIDALCGSGSSMADAGISESDALKFAENYAIRLSNGFEGDDLPVQKAGAKLCMHNYYAQLYRFFDDGEPYCQYDEETLLKKMRDLQAPCPHELLLMD